MDDAGAARKDLGDQPPRTGEQPPGAGQRALVPSLASHLKMHQRELARESRAEQKVQVRADLCLTALRCGPSSNATGRPRQASALPVVEQRVGLLRREPVTQRVQVAVYRKIVEMAPVQLEMLAIHRLEVYDPVAELRGPAQEIRLGLGRSAGGVGCRGS